MRRLWYRLTCQWVKLATEDIYCARNAAGKRTTREQAKALLVKLITS